MTEPTQIPQFQSAEAIQPNAPRPNARPDRAGGAAFQALLEKLEAQAKQLEASTQGLDDPRALAGAVDVARASLDDASSLGDQLLEAFRSSQLQDPEEQNGPGALA